MSLDDSFSMGDLPSVASQRTLERRAQSGWSEVAGMPGGGGAFDDVEISVAERQARAAEATAEAAMRTARATEASKVFDGERLRMQQEQIEISRAKLLGSTDIVDMHDSNDMKCLRVLFNSCAGELNQQRPLWLRSQRLRRQLPPRTGCRQFSGASRARWSVSKSSNSGSPLLMK